MQNAEELTPQQISGFLKGSQGIEFSGQSRAERYAWTEGMLVAQEYAQQAKKQKGAIRACLSKVTGMSLPQIISNAGAASRSILYKWQPLVATADPSLRSG